jgi:hypothetical protein
MDYKHSLISLANEGFCWKRFRDYFPFGEIALGEGNYQRLVTKALEILANTEQRALLLSMLDAQAAVFLEQVLIQNEQFELRGEEGPFIIEAPLSSTWLQINDNLRREYGISPRNVRGALLNLKPPETLVDRIIRPTST